MDATQARLGSTSAVGSERAPTPPNLRHRWAQQGRQDSPHVEGGNGGDRAQPRFAVCTSPAPCCVVWGACTGGATREVGVPSRVAAAAAPPRLGGLSDPPRDHGAGGHALRTLPPLVILAAYVLYIHTDAGRGRTARPPPPPVPPVSLLPRHCPLFPAALIGKRERRVMRPCPRDQHGGWRAQANVSFHHPCRPSLSCSTR